MAIDRSRSKALSQVVQQHPGMSAVAAAPALLVFGLVWWATNPFIAILLGVAALGGGIYFLTRQQ